MSEIKACPSGESTYHKPYIVKPERPLGLVLWQKKAWVQCTCGFRGAERGGDNAIEEAIKVWNRRDNTEIIGELENLNFIQGEIAEFTPNKTFFDEVCEKFNKRVNDLITKLKSEGEG